ncbi:hypothetical protein CR513_28595, partial [Mucuna pruriens]
MPMNANNIFNISIFNSGQDPHQNNQNGFRCRLCNRVFSTFQALTAHVESHFVQENPIMRSLYSPNHVNSQREMIPNLLQPNFPRPMMVQEPRNLVNNRVFHAPPPQPMVMPRPRANSFSYAIQQVVVASQPLQGPPQAILSAENNVAEMTRLLALPIHQREMEVSPIDGTKPYINLLDKSINNNRSFNRTIINGDISNLGNIDPTLKLPLYLNSESPIVDHV